MKRLSLIGSCAIDGSSNYILRDLTFNKVTGKFNGTMVTNQCSQAKYGLHNGESVSAGTHSASCISQAIPAPAYAGAGPNGAPLRGRIALSLYGVNIYGPFEAGFSLGQACTNSKGSCDAGVDVGACFSKITYECGESNVKFGMMSDDCGGHASPYHYHEDLTCDYDRSNSSSSSSGHSPLIAISLDGYGIYGMWETAGTAPNDLDACGGHYGPVPARTIGANTYEASTNNVYHYHTQGKAPFILGCYGPVSSLAQCKSLYPSTCGSGFLNFTTTTGCAYNYDTDCPCYQGGAGETYNQISQCIPTKKSHANYLGHSALLPLILITAVLILL